MKATAKKQNNLMLSLYSDEWRNNFPLFYKGCINILKNPENRSCLPIHLLTMDIIHYLSNAITNKYTAFALPFAPRIGKSLLFSIYALWLAYYQPSHNVYFICISRQLLNEHKGNVQRLLKAFQIAFNGKKLHEENRGWFTLIESDSRIYFNSASGDGFIGTGGSTVIVDDLIDPKDIGSVARKEELNRIFHSLQTRQDSKKYPFRIIFSAHKVGKGDAVEWAKDYYKERYIAFEIPAYTFESQAISINIFDEKLFNNIINNNEEFFKEYGVSASEWQYYYQTRLSSNNVSNANLEIDFQYKDLHPKLKYLYEYFIFCKRYKETEVYRDNINLSIPVYWQMIIIYLKRYLIFKYKTITIESYLNIQSFIKVQEHLQKLSITKHLLEMLNTAIQKYYYATNSRDVIALLDKIALSSEVKLEFYSKYFTEYCKASEWYEPRAIYIDGWFYMPVNATINHMQWKIEALTHKRAQDDEETFNNIYLCGLDSDKHLLYPRVFPRHNFKLIKKANPFALLKNHTTQYGILRPDSRAELSWLSVNNDAVIEVRDCIEELNDLCYDKNIEARYIYILVDPAFSDKTTGDYFVIWVILVKKFKQIGEYKYYVLDGYRDRGLEPEERRKKITEYYIKYSFNYKGVDSVVPDIYIEGHGGGHSDYLLLKNFFNELNNKYYNATNGIIFFNEKVIYKVMHKQSKEMRINQLKPMIKDVDSQITFPDEIIIYDIKGNKEEIVQQLTNECHGNSRYDDLADALAFIVTIREGNIDNTYQKEY